MEERTQEHPEEAPAVPRSDAVAQVAAALEIIKTDKPARRFYANMADL